jgi:hypothetical protein
MDVPVLLPSFPINSYSHLVPTLERNGITALDLVSSEGETIAKRLRLPVREVEKLRSELLQALQDDILLTDGPIDSGLIGTGLDQIDQALGGGVKKGCLTEVVGER